MEQNRKIDVRKRGNALGVWFFKASLAMFGLKAAHGLLYLVCIHYLIFDREAVNGAMAYIKRRFPGEGTIARYLHVYKLFVSQGKQLIDRHAALSGHVNFDFDLLGMEQAPADMADEVWQAWCSLSTIIWPSLGTPFTTWTLSTLCRPTPRLRSSRH